MWTLILTIIFLFKIPQLQTTVMIDCALGAEKCPVDGGWTLWSLWGPCEGECGAVGRQVRTRTCCNPRPENNGEDCDGESRQLKQCSVPGCNYEQYEKLLFQNSLRAEQLKLLQKLSGSQSALLTKCLTSSCEFQDVENAMDESADEFWNALICVKKNTGCPVSGGWGEWSAWTRCSAKCGEGQQMKCRVCCDPPPSSADYVCPGDPCVYQPCTGSDCKVAPGHMAEGAWSEWSEWSKCNTPCRFGITRRSRVCRRGRQNKKRKSANEDVDIFDYDYYDAYSANNLDGYGCQQKSYYYDKSVAEESQQIVGVVKRDDDKCDRNVEYYSTEDDEEESPASWPTSTTITRETQLKLESTKPKGNLKSTAQTDNIEPTTNEKTEIDLQPQGKTKKVKNKFRISNDETLQSTPDDLNTKELSVSESLESTPPEYESLESESSYVTRSTLLEKKTSERNGEVEDDKFLNISVASNKLQTTRMVKKPDVSQNSKHTDLSHKKDATTLEYLSKSKRTTLYSGTASSQSIRKSSSNWKLQDILRDDETCEGACDYEQITLETVESECTGGLYKGNFLNKPIIAGKSDGLQTDAVPITEVTEKTAKGKGNVKMVPVKSGDNADTTKHYLSSEPSILTTKKCKTTKSSDEADTTEHSLSSKPSILTTTTTYKTTESDDETDTPEHSLSSKTSILTTTTYKTTEPSHDTDTTGLSYEPSVFTTTTYKTTATRITGESKAIFPSTFFTTETSIVPSSSTPTVTNSLLTTRTETENTQTSSTLPSTSLVPDEDNDSGNMSVSSGVSCDLRGALQLPSPGSSFEVEECTGPFEEIKACNVSFCNEDGGWSSWSTWSACSAECGFGKQVAERSCTNPKKRSSACRGAHTWRRPCYMQPCPVKVAAARAVLTSADSKVKYGALLRYSSVLMLYVRFRPNSGNGDLVRRQAVDCTDRDCDHVRLSLYNGHLLLSVRNHKCRTTILTSSTLSIGEWHDALVAVVGARVTLSVDDQRLPRMANLSCRPDSPNYDSDMKIGGGFLGEVDRLVVNFQDYALIKKHDKRDTWSEGESVLPLESPQVQAQTSQETPTLSLAQLILAPCFSNESVWKLELAIKPKFVDGIVLFLHGHGSGDFLVVTLEQTRVRLRVKTSAEAGECEQSSPVGPQTWLHIALSKAPDAPVSMMINGGERCLAEAAGNGTDEPSIRCNGGIMLGEVPLSVKKVLDSDTAHVEPVHSPLGELGMLSVDNQTLDLSLLVRKIPPDLAGKYPSSRYKLSSYAASSSAYYEEELVLRGEPISLLCLYDVTGELSKENVYSKDDDPDISQSSTSWIKLDLPVETALEKRSPSISDNGRASMLNISGNYSDYIEGFYSCWLNYPFPLQPGYNIITYGVLTAGTLQEGDMWYKGILIFCLVGLLVLLIIVVSWLVLELVFDFINKSGYYRCPKLTSQEAWDVLHIAVFSKKGIEILGDEINSHEAMNRFENHLAAEKEAMEALAEAGEEAETSGAEETTTEAKTTENETEEDTPDRRTRDVKISIPKKEVNGGYKISKDKVKPRHSIPKSDKPVSPQIGRKRIASAPAEEVAVAVMSDIRESPFFQERDKFRPGTQRRKLVQREGSLDINSVSLEELQESELDYNSADEAPKHKQRTGDNFIEVSRDWRKREVKSLTYPHNIGLIQNTPAYQNIESELKFLPEKFKDLGKYEVVNKNAKYK